MTEVVKFDIGGQNYKVSRSLLQMHPDSMLAKSASDQWQEDPEAEIFIEGNGSRFQYVLDYLRHGSICLPITESKEALMKELEYYGIEVDENTIDEKAMIKAKISQASKSTIQELKDYSGKTGIEYHCTRLASDCIYSSENKSHAINSYLNEDAKARENAKGLRALLRALLLDNEKARSKRPSQYSWIASLEV